MANQKKKPQYEDVQEGGGAPLKVIAAAACYGLAGLLIYILLARPQPGTAMGAIRDVMRGIGGGASPLLSLLLAWVGTLLVFSARGRRVRVLNVVMNALLFVFAFGAVQLFSARTLIEQQMSITTFANFVSKSYQYGRGGGALGALLAYPLYMNLGQWGGLIVALIAALLCLLATGRAQKIYRWIAERADEGQHRVEQHRNERKAERIFDYTEGFDDPPRPQPRRSAQPQRPMRAQTPRPQRPTRRVEPKWDSVVIHSSATDFAAGDRPARDATASEKPAPKRRSVRNRMYQETFGAAAEAPAPEPTDMEIPKPLRKIRQSRAEAAEAEAADARAPRGKGGFPRDIPDYFSVEADAEDAPSDDAKRGAEEAMDVEPDVKKASGAPSEVEPASRRSAAKPKRVVEGVRPLALDDEADLEVEPEAEDDEAPFDIPHEQPAGKKPRAANPEPEFEEEEPYNYPPIDLLSPGEQVKSGNAHKDADDRKAEKLISTLESFGIETRLIGIAHGPAVTRFELQPAPGVRVSRITALADDIALGLAARSVRIEAPIPGKAAVGVEIPNDKVEMVRLREVLESTEARRHPSKIAVGLGKDNSGRYIVADIAKMPHVLIAGQTGSGKSVCINSIISSILYRATPEEVRMILIDPKVVELSIYNDIPHLIAPVVTDPKKASSALEWAVAEMSTRYKRFAERGVRDIKGYNKALEPGEKRMPQMVIVIDELADLMMVCPGEVEDSICRLAQLARAAGMHLVIATQRPSVNVITGVIKANIPTRIAFSVASQVDSRTMIDHGGAEKLLGNGDMLFVPPGTNKPIRVQGAWVSDDEVHNIVSYIKARTEVTYDEDVVEKIENSVRSDAEREDVEQEYDPKLAEAVEIVVEAGQASVSMLQRRMRVGYARAGRLIDEMEKRGIVSEADGAKPRSVLISREQFMQMFGEELGE